MIQLLAVLLIGFSVVSLVILFVAYAFFLEGAQKTARGITACGILSAALVGLQLDHLSHIGSDVDPFQTARYTVFLFTVPAAFYFFSRDLLLPEARLSLRDIPHLLPVFAGVFLPSELVAPVAFTIGAGYSLWLARIVHGMRQHVRRFRFEMFFFGLFAVLATVVLIIVFSIPWIGSSAFYIAYAHAIGIALVLVVAALVIFPEILSDISDAAKLAYANSTLKGIDVEATLQALDRLMTKDKLHCNESLTLAMLADALDLSAHQASELINTRFGVGFSRFIRERRVAEAKQILTEDQRSSVLSVGMTCGFGSQSTFYAAFREITGESPAAFRKKASEKGNDPSDTITEHSLAKDAKLAKKVRGKNSPEDSERR